MTRVRLSMGILFILLLTASSAYAALWFRDADSDGWGDDGDTIESPTQPAGYVAIPGDCDDNDSGANPGAAEVWYDGIDQDCDGLSDYDQDMDGFNSADFGGDDCDDFDSGTHPFAPETWYDGIDRDCDGWNDFDMDGDSYVAEGYGSEAGGSSPFTNDCDDTDETVHPGAPEVCDDGVDQDCDGSDQTSIEYHEDLDSDGFGNPNYALYSCTGPEPGWVLDGSDCDDTDETVHPGAAEICGDLIDNDCDSLIDEDCEVFSVGSISDVGNDQGGQVRIGWNRIHDDAPGVGDDIVGYDIYRRIDSYKSAVSDKTWPPGDWDFIRQVPASGEDTYFSVVPSLCDSTDTGICWSVYFLRARTTLTHIFHDTPPDSGYSIDNLAPSAPLNLSAAYEAAGVTLHWDESEAADFDYFRIYRSDDPGFIISAEALVRTTTATAWTDLIGDSWSRHYKITAVDFSGNESEAAMVQSVSGLNTPAATGRLLLHANVPNPFNPSTTLRYELPAEQHLRLEIFALDGRRVALLVDGRRAEGIGRVVWNGRADNGQVVASGSYICRLVSGGDVISRRISLLK